MGILVSAVRAWAFFRASVSLRLALSFLCFKNILFLFLREKASMSGGGRQRKGEKQAPPEQGAPRKTQSQDPKIMTLATSYKNTNDSLHNTTAWLL